MYTCMLSCCSTHTCDHGVQQRPLKFHVWSAFAYMMTIPQHVHMEQAHIALNMHVLYTHNPHTHTHTRSHTRTHNAEAAMHRIVDAANRISLITLNPQHNIYTSDALYTPHTSYACSHAHAQRGGSHEPNCGQVLTLTALITLTPPTHTHIHTTRFIRMQPRAHTMRRQP